ncbi:STM4504/CBY_0614 family protein [Aeromonas hydrophila]|uniref:STM4504/CBY_0614 family protein n=1 Tax=Aeromonas hydrophila TaxID=644 RepID=UPI003D1A5DB4
MAIFDLFSKRQRRARGEVPDVYVYDKLPRELKVQIIHIIEDAIGIDNYGSSNVLELYEFINKALCREYGVFELIKNAQSDQFSIFNFFLQETSIERSLDVVELCFKYISYIAENRNFQYQTDRKIEPEDAILELNERFRENGVGFQFESGEIIRVDSEFIHSEAVKPTLAILRAPGFKGANEEFLQAHEHYRHGRHKECLVDCLKAFESTMKAICKIRQWEIKPNDTAKALIATCFSNGLIPNYLETQFSSIRSALESGVPTVRNKNGGHGQGAEPIAVPEYMARYALNLTATSILFIVDAHNAP